jgi:hypothetical protein
MARIDKSTLPPATAPEITPKQAAKLARGALVEALRAVAALGPLVPDARVGAEVPEIRAALEAAAAAATSYEDAIKALED